MSCTQSRGALRSHTAHRMPEKREALAAGEGRGAEEKKKKKQKQKPEKSI